MAEGRGAAGAAVDSADLERQARRDTVLPILALVSLSIGVADWLEPREEPGFTALDAVDLAIVLYFDVDFALQALRSGDPRRYALRHWWEWPALLPITGGLMAGFEGYAVVRGVRVVRVVRLARALRTLGVAARLGRLGAYAARVAVRARLLGIATVGLLVVLAGAVAVRAVEGPVNPRVVDWGDAVWWSTNVFLTVTYLDFVPRTVGGRAVATFLMAAGVSFLALFTASLANAFLKEPGPWEEVPRQRPRSLE